MPSNHLILCQPLLLLPSIFPSIRVFSSESAFCIRCPKYWSFSFTISPSNEQPRLISFRMDWLDLLAVQGTLKSLLQHHSSKASVLWLSAWFIVQLSHISLRKLKHSLVKLPDYTIKWSTQNEKISVCSGCPLKLCCLICVSLPSLVSVNHLKVGKHIKVCQPTHLPDLVILATKSFPGPH